MAQWDILLHFLFIILLLSYKIDEGADVDGYIKRVNQGKSTSSSPKQTPKASKDKKDKQLEIEDSGKKAVNQS